MAEKIHDRNVGPFKVMEGFVGSGCATGGPMVSPLTDCLTEIFSGLEGLAAVKTILRDFYESAVLQDARTIAKRDLIVELFEYF